MQKTKMQLYFDLYSKNTNKNKAKQNKLKPQIVTELNKFSNQNKNLIK